MKVVELREKKVDELLNIVDELKVSIHQNKMDLIMKKSQSNHSVKVAKKDLARVLTIIEEKRNT
jgi:ribosomal protein L29